MTKAKTYSPEIEQYVLKQLERGFFHCSVRYWLDYDEGYLLRGEISLTVLDEEGEEIEFGDGLIFQVSHMSVSEDYLQMAADMMSGHFEAVTGCIRDNDEDLVNFDHVYYLSDFNLFPQFQGKGYGRKAADLAIRSAGGIDCPVFIYPSQDEEKLSFDRLKKFWIDLHPRAVWDEEYQTVYIDQYEKQKIN